MRWPCFYTYACNPLPLPLSHRRPYQGLFLAPTIVGESLKGAFLLAEVFGGTFGLPTNPQSPLSPAAGAAAGDVVALNGDARAGTEAAAAAVEGGGRGGGIGGRTDIVQALELGDRDRLIKFCEAVQLFSPVNAYVRPGELLLHVWRTVCFGVPRLLLFEIERNLMVAPGKLTLLLSSQIGREACPNQALMQASTRAPRLRLDSHSMRTNSTFHALFLQCHLFLLHPKSQTYPLCVSLASLSCLPFLPPLPSPTPCQCPV